MYPFFHSVFGLDLVRFGVWHHYLRKTGHFVGYFTLSILLFRAWRATLPASTDFEFEVHGNWSFRWARISVLMTILVACADEWHQSYIPSRTGSIRDVWLDGTAGLVAQIVVFVWLKMRGRKAEHSTALRLSHPAAPGDD